MITIQKLIENDTCELSNRKETLCAVVSRDGFPDQKIALSKLPDAIRLLVPVTSCAVTPDEPATSRTQKK